jgi:hypothetical protein
MILVDYINICIKRQNLNILNCLLINIFKFIIIIGAKIRKGAYICH